MEEKIFSISDYIKIVNQGLKAFNSKIIGEVSKVNFGPTGHIYLPLKMKAIKFTVLFCLWRNY